MSEMLTTCELTEIAREINDADGDAPLAGHRAVVKFSGPLNGDGAMLEVEGPFMPALVRDPVNRGNLKLRGAGGIMPDSQHGVKYQFTN